MDDLEVEWRDFDGHYCKHGYYRGMECDDCDTSSPVEVLEADEVLEEMGIEPNELP